MTETNLLDEVLARIKPSPDEQQRIKKVADNIISRINQVTSRLGLSDVSSMLVGSAARNTWISGEHDLDIFISFPENTPDEDLKIVGLKIAREVALEAGGYEERYAEHPYIHARFGDFKVDLVPCFRVTSAACIKSAVDRTPFHNQFVLSRFEGREDEVLLLKQFLKGSGVYGSDLRTGGFSGYLAELLIIHYGSFEKVLAATDSWKPGTQIDIVGSSIRKYDEPLVVVDPTDPGRNVAAALTMDKFARFVDAARQYMESPLMEQFFPVPLPPISDEEFGTMLTKRGMPVIAVVFDKPDVVDDVLYSQLFLLLNSVRDLMIRNEFEVYKADVWSGGRKAAIVLEIFIEKLPPVKRHLGPPVWSKSHAKHFKAKYQSHNGISKVYIQNGRYVVDVLRKYTDVTRLIKSELHTCRLGKHVGVSIRSGFSVLTGSELLMIDVEDFRIFLKDFFNA